MRKARLVKSAAILMSLLSMTACHKKSPGMDSDMMGDGSGNSQTYGMSSDQNNFSEQGGGIGGGSYARHVNSMTAPSNQVYYFQFDQASMQPSDMAALNVQARYISTHPSAHVRLEGNTDDRGSREYNVGLGWRRAQTVAQALEQQGVSPKQIAMVSYGKEHPAVTRENEQAWTLNRRVELIYESQ